VNQNGGGRGRKKDGTRTSGGRREKEKKRKTVHDVSRNRTDEGQRNFCLRVADDRPVYCASNHGPNSGQPIVSETVRIHGDTLHFFFYQKYLYFS
jgi:hypothetical protein